MQLNRKLDAAIGLIVLGKIYPHKFDKGSHLCVACGKEEQYGKVCYESVPNFEENKDAAQTLLYYIITNYTGCINISSTWEDQSHVFTIYKSDGLDKPEELVYENLPINLVIKSLAIKLYDINPEEL